MEEIKTLQALCNENEDKAFNDVLNLAERVAISKKYFQSAESKQEMKRTNCVLTIEQFAQIAFGYKRSWFYDLASVGEMDKDTIANFKRSGEPLGVKNLLKFVSVQTDKANGTDANETDANETTETDVKVKPKTFKAIAKDGKVSIEGDAPEKDLCELVAQINKVIEQKRKERSESKAA